MEHVGSGTERAGESDEAKKMSDTNGRFIRVSIGGVGSQVRKSSGESVAEKWLAIEYAQSSC